MSSSITQKNYFELFSLPITFETDLSLLAANYQHLQRAVHPDRFAQTSKQEQNLAVEYAAYINQAYQTLKNPLNRAEYILGLYKIAVDADNTVIMSNEFLIQQMELREEMEAIPHRPDPVLALDKLVEKVSFQQEKLFARLNELFMEIKEDNLLLAAQIVQELKFITRMEEELRELDVEY